MYSWGDDTSTWKRPGAYKYGSARRAYMDRDASAAAAKGPRTYGLGSRPNSTLVGTRGKDISSDSEHPIILATDVTGSMSHWPGEIFDRLPLLYQTLANYQTDLEVSFAAIGDAYSDSYPLQVSAFGKGPTLDDYLKALYPEGGGGGQTKESYDLFAYFMLHHCATPKATSPFLIIFGDEGFYEEVNPDQVAHYIGDTLQDTISTADVWKGLLQRFDLYLLHKEYGGSDKFIVDQWADAIGRQRIVPLPSAERAVDIAMGLIARKWGKLGDFSVNISARHDSKTVDTVMKSLRYLPPASTKGSSTTLKGKSGKKSEPLT